MWNILKWRKRKREKRQLHSIAYIFAVINECYMHGLLYWHTGNQTLLIEENLAKLQLAQGEKGFRNFLNNITQWQNFLLLCEAYDHRVIDIESAAIREAQTQRATPLSSSDRQRVRMLARSQMGEISTDDLKLVHEFDIYIIRATAVSAVTATEDKGELLAVGHYDGQQLEMALYQEIENQLHHE